ncbi:MAG TPA: hypothetical protein PKE30_11735 [Niabella sp.]|nr:hypothetical protein [Niabella sp.]
MQALSTHRYKLTESSCLIFLILGIGVVLRLCYFFQNRSLWIDEAYLSNSVVSYSLHKLLTEPLLYYQKAPLGFLMMQKLCITVFSPNELALRLFPLLCSLCSLFIFYAICRYFLKPGYIWLALVVFCLAPPLIFHAAEAKQYSSELLSPLIILYLYTQLQRRGFTNKAVLRLGVAGAVLMWFSYSVVFVLAATGICVFFKIFKQKHVHLYRHYLIMLVLWIASFAVSFYFSTYKHVESKWTVYWFDYFRYFAPFPPKNIEDIGWYLVRFYRLLDYPLGLLWNFVPGSEGRLAPVLKLAIVPATLFFAGLYNFFRRKTDFALFVFSIALTLIASALKLYPLGDRFWVFLSPVFIILIAEGCCFFNQKFMPLKLRFILPVLLLIGPVVNVINAFRGNEFIYNKNSAQREALTYINDHKKEEDLVYVYWNNLAGYNVYNKMYRYNFAAAVGKDYRKDVTDYNDYVALIKKDILAQNKKRVWIVLNQIFQTDIGEPIDWPEWYFAGPGKPSDRVIAMLGEDWKLVDSYSKLDVSIYCFQLNP